MDFSSGHKLLLSHGWDDGLIPPQSTVNFYTALTQHSAANAAQNARLFMILAWDIAPDSFRSASQKALAAESPKSLKNDCDDRAGSSGVDCS